MAAAPSRQFITQDEYRDQYPGAFSAADIQAVMVLPGGELHRLGQLSALSISTHRDVFPVTSMGSIKPRGFTRGHRTVAGTLLFNTIDRAALSFGGDPLNANLPVSGGKQFAKPLADQFPLFDIYLTYVNEVGMLSTERVYGVAVLDFGKTVSLENLNPLEQYSYMALDYAPLQSIHTPKPSAVKIEPTEAQKRAPRVYGADATQYGLGRRLESLLPQTAEQFSRQMEEYLSGLRGDR